MILSPEKYQIDNARAICRLLPFWIRGRKTILFLEAVAHPLKSVHITGSGSILRIQTIHSESRRMHSQKEKSFITFLRPFLQEITMLTIMVRK